MFDTRHLSPDALRAPDHELAVPAAYPRRERARLARPGRRVARTDAAIAAVAVCNGLTRVTRKTMDLTAFEGLRVADWHARRTVRRG